MIAYNGRNIRGRRFGRRAKATITYTKNEPYALAFYLYTLLEGKSNQTIVSEFENLIHAFLEYTNKLNKNVRLCKVLEKEIIKLEEQRKLTLLSEPANEEMCFSECDIPYMYEQDKRVDRTIRNYDNYSTALIDLYRILINSDKTTFTSIINTVIFSDSENYSLTDKLELSRKTQKAILDISKTQFLVDQVQLTEAEARYILLLCRFNSNDELRFLMRNNDLEVRENMADMLGITSKDLSYMLRSDQKIKTFGFVDDDGEYNFSLNECIEAQSIEPYFSDLLKPLDCGKAYELESFSVRPESTEICIDLLKGKNPVSILFYGKPGSGKTELAKAICKSTGKKIYIFKNETEAVPRSPLGELACLLSMERQDSILIVDEADSLLRTLDFNFFGSVPSKTKGTVNKMLENNCDKVIYIINHQHQIDESTLRRFTFSIKFEAMPARQLRSIAKTKIESIELADETKLQILDMFDKYKLTGQSVDNIVKTIEGMECKDEESLLKKVGIVMKENSQLLNGKSKMRDSVKSEYDPGVLNASMNPLEIVEMVENAAKFAEKNKGSESGIRMLFYGLSGTGKTEFARYISEQLGKPIILKRASDILGMYVGQNEKNICNAFAEAEASDSILLFDEADSFFYDRNQARASWERSTVNEFLTQMEEFSGILICTTNLRNIMDPAMQRRFHILVEFKPMKFEGIKNMLERYFPSFHLSNKEIEELENSESVTPGDFGTLSSRIRFMNQDKVNSTFILKELKKMQIEKKNHWHEEGTCAHKIGFGA